MAHLLVPAVLAILHLAAVGSACHALLHKRDSGAALGWVALLLFMPPAGLPLYWLFGIARVDSQAVRLMEKAAQQVVNGLLDLHGRLLEQEPWGAVRDESLPAVFRHLVRPGRAITGRAVAGGNAVLPLHNGEEAYPVMLRAIEKARRRVYLSTFIFGNDAVGESFAAALARAAERGCDVRLLMDGVGSFHPLAGWKRRLGPGVRLAYFLPPALVPPQLSINLRTHRKMLVCDGQEAFTGGMNISEHHLAALPRPERVQDVHFRCVGPVARQLEVAFLLDWRFVTAHAARMAADPGSSILTPGRHAFIRKAQKAGAPDSSRAIPADDPGGLPGARAVQAEPSAAGDAPGAEACGAGASRIAASVSATELSGAEASSSERPGPDGLRAAGPGPDGLGAEGSGAPGGSSLCRILMDGPGSPDKTIEDLFCAMISSARASVRIMSPYFLPSPRLASALSAAVLRGVDVTVIVPEENNHRLVDWAMRHQIPLLEAKGVRIFRQPPPFAHTKLLLVDGAYTLLGSANLDPRSLNLNFELVMEVFDTALAADLGAFYDAVRERSALCSAASPPTLPARLRNAASWLFSPYL